MTQQSGADAILQRMSADTDAPKVLNNCTQRMIDGLIIGVNTIGQIG